MKDPHDDKTIDMFEEVTGTFYAPYVPYIGQTTVFDSEISHVEFFRRKIAEACGGFKKKECDHIYFPVLHELTKKPIGQRCSICLQFNSIEDLSRHSSVGRAHSW